MLSLRSCAVPGAAAGQQRLPHPSVAPPPPAPRRRPPAAPRLARRTPASQRRCGSARSTERGEAELAQLDANQLQTAMVLALRNEVGRSAPCYLALRPAIALTEKGAVASRAAGLEAAELAYTLALIPISHSIRCAHPSPSTGTDGEATMQFGWLMAERWARWVLTWRRGLVAGLRGGGSHPG